LQLKVLGEILIGYGIGTLAYYVFELINPDGNKRRIEKRK
jgi:hypothetical protein